MFNSTTACQMEHDFAVFETTFVKIEHILQIIWEL